MFVFKFDEFPYRLMLYVYGLLVFLKFTYQFDDGYSDVVILGIAAVSILARPHLASHELSKLMSERVAIFWALFTVYYMAISFYSYNSIGNIVIEYFSVFKWLMYFFAGYLMMGVRRVRAVTFPSVIDVAVVVTVILVFSLYNYNFGGLGGVDELFGFYDNSFGSIFMLRSVFAIFGFIVAVYALNIIDRHGYFGGYLLLSSLLFVFMSGNRKILLAALLVMLFISWRGRFRHIFSGMSYGLVIVAVLMAVNLSIVERSINEYSNPDQPRLLAYAIGYQIAIENFPFGSGPATFASRGSMKNYSPIYEKYGLDERWGFRESDDVHFYNDTYWAQIIGQYGFVGLVLVLLALWSIWQQIGEDDSRVGNRLLLFAVLLLSITTPALQRTEVALFVFFVFGMYVRQRDMQYRGKNEYKS